MKSRIGKGLESLLVGAGIAASAAGFLSGTNNADAQDQRPVFLNTWTIPDPVYAEYNQYWLNLGNTIPGEDYVMLWRDEFGFWSDRYIWGDLIADDTNIVFGTYVRKGGGVDFSPGKTNVSPFFTESVKFDPYSFYIPDASISSPTNGQVVSGFTDVRIGKASVVYGHPGEIRLRIDGNPFLVNPLMPGDTPIFKNVPTQYLSNGAHTLELQVESSGDPYYTDSVLGDDPTFTGISPPVTIMVSNNINLNVPPNTFNNYLALSGHTTPVNSEVVLDVYDGHNKIRSLTNNISNGSFNFGWDGRDSSGVDMPPNMYKLIVNARDTSQAAFSPDKLKTIESAGATSNNQSMTNWIWKEGNSVSLRKTFLPRQKYENRWLGLFPIDGLFAQDYSTFSFAVEDAYNYLGPGRDVYTASGIPSPLVVQYNADLQKFLSALGDTNNLISDVFRNGHVAKGPKAGNTNVLGNSGIFGGEYMSSFISCQALASVFKNSYTKTNMPNSGSWSYGQINRAAHTWWDAGCQSAKIGISAAVGIYPVIYQGNYQSRAFLGWNTTYSGGVFNDSAMSFNRLGIVGYMDQAMDVPLDAAVAAAAAGSLNFDLNDIQIYGNPHNKFSGHP